MDNKTKKQLAIGLIITLFIIYFQVILGGTTRLTGSGLSITRWDIVTGTLPPLTANAWNDAFQLYQQTPQYHKLNKGMSMPEFKAIFFWEWLHRLWGRFGFVFLVGLFAYFYRRLDRQTVFRFGTVFALYAAQGVLGWFMVASGLVDMPWVSHYRLTAHLLLAIVLFAYILWFAADLLLLPSQKVTHPATQRWAYALVPLVLLQIAYGGFMSGLHAAMFFPSFPDYNGSWLPTNLLGETPFYKNFFEGIATIQFIHRTLAYILAVLIIWFWIQVRRVVTTNPYLHKTTNLLLLLLVVQISLGATVLLLSKQGIPVFWGVLHQAVGLLLLSTLLFICFQYNRVKAINSSTQN